MDNSHENEDTTIARAESAEENNEYAAEAAAVSDNNVGEQEDDALIPETLQTFQPPDIAANLDAEKDEDAFNDNDIEMEEEMDPSQQG